MIREKAKNEQRSETRIRAHYEVEVELADKLRASSAEERQSQNLYTAVYDELYRRVPDHPQLTKKTSPEDTEKDVAWQRGLLKRFLSPDTVFLEVGPGDCALSLHLAKRVKKVVAVDVSKLVTENASDVANFELVLYDGCHLPLPPETVDVIYSNQLMEHIHEEDALEQLRSIYNTLAAGGRYLCITPNRIGGPWDISMYYDTAARGFHMKEYTTAELARLFKHVGFKKMRAYAGARGKYVRIPLALAVGLEKFLILLPYGIRTKLGRSLPFRMLLGIKLLGIK